MEINIKLVEEDNSKVSNKAIGKLLLGNDQCVKFYKIVYLIVIGCLLRDK